MTPPATDALPPFLRYLASFPEPTELAAALVKGPLAVLGARTCVVMVAFGDTELRLISTHGFSEAANDHYRTAALDLDVPVVTAYVENRTLVHDLAGFSGAHRDLADNMSDWADVVASIAHGTVVDAPIVSEGAPLGSIGLVLEGHEQLSATDFALIEAICSTLGLWITHPRSGVPKTLATWETYGIPVLELTARQESILRQVEAGRTTGAIAAALGVSDSTVKQELGRIRRVTGSANRHEAARRAREQGLLT